MPGDCPECGRSCTKESASLLTPWPPPLTICLRVGWPLVGLGLLLLLIPWPGGLLAGLLFLPVLPLNGFFTVRGLIKRHVPEETRTEGPVHVLRIVGIVACVCAFIVFLIPAIVLGSCLISGFNY